VIPRNIGPVMEWSDGCLAGEEYGLQMQRALLRLLEAVARETDATAAGVQGELRVLDEAITRLPASTERPMARLARRFGWSPQEVDFVWLAVAVAADPRLLVHARALDAEAGRGLSTALYCRIARPAAADAWAIQRALQSDRSLPRTGLLQPAPGAWIPSSTPWVPVSELVHHLLGEPAGSLPAGVARVQAPDAILDDDQRAALHSIRSALGSRGVILVIEGSEGTGRRSAVSLASDRPVLALDLSKTNGTPEAIEIALIGLVREAVLRDAIPVVVGVDELISDGGLGPRGPSLVHQLERASAPVALVTSRAGVELGIDRPTVRVTWPVPNAAARLALWRDLAGGDDREALAQRFRIGAGAIGRAVASARAISSKSIAEPLSSTELIAGLRHNIAERMSGLAERVVVKQTWDDCVLSEDMRAQVLALIGRTEHAHVVYERWGYRSKMPRGTGVAAMFSGPPGTGKTMVAGLIANHLGLELYQVDLSKVVSKWIGETEKQLSKLFDAAEDGHAMLLFDEADSLFGQRSSEMKSATDRYANLEVNFLLQRIESFHGLVILTTNLDASIDKAFKRRLAAHLVFQPPDEEERALLWERMVAADGAPLARDIDPRVLARQFPKMTGANIRNAALAAAFLTATQRKPAIDQAVLVTAARGEYLSMGHVLATGSL
jgi:hypothetical protein